MNHPEDRHRVHCRVIEVRMPGILPTACDGRLLWLETDGFDEVYRCRRCGARVVIRREVVILSELPDDRPPAIASPEPGPAARIVADLAEDLSQRRGS